ncbi:MAG TPA: ribose-phosphate pyrophosphokinase-like domain-containing protein [Bacteroidia bacterium]|nr:ribose-phosphate pyrophosphokinase-like domain-containing protein [Bacteroidia bacterium]
MKTININSSINITRIIFPDNQPHIRIEGIEEGDDVRVICSITDSAVLIQLLECANAIENAFAKKKTLVIPYLMGARYDRLMQKGDSIDLKVIAMLINSMEFEKVYLFDVHSDASLLLINNSVNISNAELVKAYNKENAVLICPDAGASKKISGYLKLNNITDVAYCTKSRDLSNGHITLKVNEPEKCINRNCVIIDDICDGGATFLTIAEQIKPEHLVLIVTHGIFSKGFETLEKRFDEIIVSDSYCKTYTSPIVKTIKATITE